MAQSLANILIHVVFCTKGRERVLLPEKRPELYEYLGGIMRDLKCPGLAIGGTEDHVHVLAVLSKNVAACKIVEEIKRGSSRWLNGKGSGGPAFHWQTGYGIFSVSESNRPAVMAYIADQKNHHRRMTFKEEFRHFLAKHNVPYDERYVWD